MREREYKTPLRRLFEKKERSPVKLCAWFAGCTNKAEGTQEHPTLGSVPICKRCQKFVEG